ncbi:MAG: hypothetical protein ABJA75_24945 [Bradyrhizobium sp.]
MRRREFVETLYQKQARLQAERSPLGEEEFYALFSRRMRKLMQAPRPKNPNLGPLSNAFFGRGVLPGADIKIGKVALVDGDDTGPATIRVEIEHRGEPRKILVRVVTENDAWRIANISYDFGGSLREYHCALTGR